MTDTVEHHAQSLIEQFDKLRAENERLKAQVDDRWKHVNAAAQLRNEVAELKGKLEKVAAECERHRIDAAHWRKAVRYEQALKRPRKVVRHLPIYNQVIRAKRRDGHPWLMCRTNPERIYLKHWRKENTRVSGLNSGRGVLEVILSEDNTVADLTQRDATVAASVVQWLGTNCGRCFVQQVLRETETSREKERTPAPASA